MNADTAPEVRLWLDWCTARHVHPDRATWEHVETFTGEVPAAVATLTRRLGAIRAHYERRRRTLNGAPDRAMVTLWPQDTGPDELRDRLWALPAYGFPHAVTGRRDAMIHVLAAHGLSRRQISSTAPGVVNLDVLPFLNGEDIDMTNHGLRCAQCALTRWLRVLSSWWNPADGPHAVERCVEDQPADVRQHDCAFPVPDGWQHARLLVCDVHRDGTLLNSPVGSRSVTRALTRTRHDRSEWAPPTFDPTPAPEPSAAPRPGPVPAERAGALHEIDTLLDQLDQAIADAAAAQDAVKEASQSGDV